ncbi:MAG: DUF6265 family protein [Chitinophagales bacterium]
MKLLLSAFILLLLAPEYNSVTKFKWLEGKWKETYTGDVEQWVFMDSVARGSSYGTNEQGQFSLTETMELVNKDGTYYYIPTVLNQNAAKPIEFKIVSFTETSFIAENPAHDFPQRIVYRLKNPNTLSAYIEGKHNGKRLRISFLFKRQ